MPSGKLLEPILSSDDHALQLHLGFLFFMSSFLARFFLSLCLLSSSFFFVSLIFSSFTFC
jgi:hypothetical protein